MGLFTKELLATILSLSFILGAGGYSGKAIHDEIKVIALKRIDKGLSKLQ